MVWGCIKRNLFNIMDFISEPSFKKVCEHNNRNISLPPSNNDGKIDVYIMNHISFLDMLVSYYSARQKKSSFVAGHALKKLSGLDVFDKMVFEVKKGFTKEDVSNKFVEYINNYEDLEVVGLAPEGNILTRENYQKSVDYCVKNNIPVFKNVLYPRFVAFNGIISALRKTNKLGKIYITTAYFPEESEIPTDHDTDSFFGRFSLFSFLVLRRIPKINWNTVEKEIKDDEDIDEWLVNQFRIIDEELESVKLKSVNLESVNLESVNLINTK
jgi:hypothetical protein